MLVGELAKSEFSKSVNWTGNECILIETLKKITVHFTLQIHVDKDMSHRDSEMNIACVQLCALYLSFMYSF